MAAASSMTESIDTNLTSAALLQPLPAIRLLKIDAELMDLIDEGAGYEARLGASFGESLPAVRDVLEQTMSLLRAAPRCDPWGCYLTIDVASDVVIGTCGFKTGPSSIDEIELAYFTYPTFEGKGYATAMATKLLQIATESGVIRVVLALTLPQVDASTKVLQKIGLAVASEMMDPQDGRVWRWERRL